MKHISLKPDQRKGLLLQAKQIKQDVKKAIRIRVILALDAGYSEKETAEILLIDTDTVTNIKKKYEKRQLFTDWLKDEYKGYQGRLIKEQETELDAYLQNEDVVITDCKQVIAYVKKSFQVSYSIEGITKLLHRLGYSYKYLVTIPGKLNANEQELWLSAYKDLKEDLKEDEVILFQDGVHPTHNPHKTRAWIKKGQVKHIKTNTGRGRLNINGALELGEKIKVITHFSETINAQEVIAHYEKIEAAYPDKRVIYLVEDNARYYKNILVEAYLNKPNRKIKRIFLPTYSPNLNFIERLWKYMKKYIIGVKYREKFKEFENDVHEFFDTLDLYQDDLKKFIGTDLHLIKKSR